MTSTATSNLRIALLGSSDASRALLTSALQQALQHDLPRLQIQSECALVRLARHAPCDPPAKSLESTEVVEALTVHRQEFGLSLLLCGADAIPSPVDQLLRHWLLQSSLPFASIFGSAAAQAGAAASAIEHHLAAPGAPAQTRPLWHWNCENCSDAACEHRLFAGLLD